MAGCLGGIYLVAAMAGTSLATAAASGDVAGNEANRSHTLEEMVVIADRLFQDTTVVSPTSNVAAADLGNTNLMTSEDFVLYEPNVSVRRRYIGDPNGTMGIRGANMFQTTRSMVFADGLPLHYLLQTSFSGSPRWSLVGPDEIDTTQVIYGPFSAEYSGNSMGGVVNIRTRRPSTRKVTLLGTYFSQAYDMLGRDDDYAGGRLYAAYEDRVGDLGFYIAYNRLDNESQPMTHMAATPSGTDGSPVTGGTKGIDDREADVLYYGDSGAESATTNLYKLKLDYEFGPIQLRGVVAYDDRDRRSEDFHHFLRDAIGATVWDGYVSFNDVTYDANGSAFQHRYQERESLLVGFGISSLIGDSGWLFDLYATNFDILKDEEIRTARNPADPEFEAQNSAFRGRLTEYDDTGWQTVDLRAGTESLLNNSDMRLSVGYHYDRYELGLVAHNYDSISDEIGGVRSASGGRTGTHALYAQWGWEFSDRWDLALGLRYEDWHGREGFFGDTEHDNRDETALSPKFSIARFMGDRWVVRYSAARAVRFPVTEELYQNVRSTTSISVADAQLAPEDGIHHNLMLEKSFSGGYVRMNLWAESIEDTIFNQNGTINGVNIRTFLPIDEVEAEGVELIYNASNVADTAWDLRFNVAYTRAKIVKNTVNPDLEGNYFPRMPRWRINLLASYAFSPRWDAGGGLRYASSSFGDLDNGDTAANVFGAQDDFLFVNFKTNWSVNEYLRLSLGIDNLLGEEAFVHHPWPGRTVFFEGKVAL